MLPSIFRALNVTSNQDVDDFDLKYNTVNGRSPEETQRLVRELIAGTTFTAWFVLTYQVVILSILLTIAVWRLASILLRWSTLRQPGTTRRLSFPFSSWWRELVEPKNQWAAKSFTKDNERSALLDNRGSNQYVVPSARLLLRLRALAMYQPAPIPLVNKILPSNASTLVISSLLGVNIFYLFFRIQFEFDLTAVFGDRAAVLFVSNLPWLYLLGAKNQPLQLLTGFSYEHLNIYHRRLGELLCLLAVIHFAATVCAWYSLFLPRGMELLDFLTRRIVALGIGAFISYELLFVTSLASFRQWWYELFLASHILLQAGGLILLFFHHRRGQVYTLISLAIFLIDRLIFRLCLRSRTFQANLQALEDGNTLLVSADWSLKFRDRFFSGRLQPDIRYGWKPSEHVFISVPAISKKHLVQAHPFTIASSAPAHGQQHAWLNLIVRVRDGFTRDLLKYTQSNSSVQIRFDGPYGSSHAWDVLERSDLNIVVAGGSGIAVAYPLIWRLVQGNTGSDEEQCSRRKHICLIWVVHDASHVSWIGDERPEELKEKGVDLVVPPPTEKDGRPDLHGIIRNRIETFANDEATGKVGVVVSGPDTMNRGIRNTCASLAWAGHDIDVAVEKFGW